MRLNRHADSSFRGVCDSSPPRLEIFGVGSLRLGDYWKSKGGPKAYYGLGAELFQLLYVPWYIRSTSLAVSMRHDFLWGTGPNSAGGHASIVFNEEVQVRDVTWGLQTLGFYSSIGLFLRERARVQIQHTMRLVKPVLKGEVRSFAVREEASATYDSWMQKRLARTMWNHCQSYYRHDGTTGKSFVMFPGHVTPFWWLARRPRYSDYVIIGGKLWR